MRAHLRRGVGRGRRRRRLDDARPGRGAVRGCAATARTAGGSSRSAASADVDDRARQRRAGRGDGVAIDPHAGNDRGPAGDRGLRRRRRRRPRRVPRQPRTRRGAASASRTCACSPTPRSTTIDGPVDVLYIDGAHRYAPGAGRHPRLGSTRVAAGRRDADPRLVLVGRRDAGDPARARRRAALPLRRALAVAGDLPRRPPRRPRWRMPRRQLAQLPWFARNVAFKVAAQARPRHGAAATRPRRAGVAVLRLVWCRDREHGFEQAAADAALRMGASDAERVGTGRGRRGRAGGGGQGPARGVAIARGLGRSYGDSAQNGGGHVLRLDDHAHDAVRIDDAAGTVDRRPPASASTTCCASSCRAAGSCRSRPAPASSPSAGRSPATSTARTTTSTARSATTCTRLTLLLADGSVVELGPDRRPELFWATVGGMGLTGVILDATFRLLPDRDQPMLGRHRPRIDDLDALLALMDEGDADYRYSVAWIDLLAKRPRTSAAACSTRGDHARLDELGAAHAGARRWRTTRSSWSPCRRSSRRPACINHATVAAFNELWYRKAPRGRAGEMQSIAAYFHPLDVVGDWNRLYGRRGFVQYQFVVPFGEETALRTVVERLAGVGHGQLPRRAQALRRRRTRRRSASRSPGWTLALDLPARQRRAGRAAARPRRARARRRRAPLPGQGLRTPRPPRSAAATRGSAEWQARPRRGRPGRACGRATRAGGYDCSTHSTAGERPWRTRSANRRRSCCSAAPATSAGPSSPSCWRPATRTVVLAARHPDEVAIAELRPVDGLTSTSSPSTPPTPSSHERFVARPRRAPRRPRRRDRRVRRARSTRPSFDDDPAAAAEAVHVNYTGAVSVDARRRRRRCGARGTASSSCCPASPASGCARRNFVYGSSKAGLDGFAQGLGDSLAGSGVGHGRAPGLRALEDDAGPEVGAVGGDAAPGRRGRGQGDEGASTQSGRRPRCATCSSSCATSHGRSSADCRSAIDSSARVAC